MNVLLDAINKIDMELHKRVQRTSKYLWSLFYCCATRKKNKVFREKPTHHRRQSGPRLSMTCVRPFLPFPSLICILHGVILLLASTRRRQKRKTDVKHIKSPDGWAPSASSRLWHCFLGGFIKIFHGPAIDSVPLTGTGKMGQMFGRTAAREGFSSSLKIIVASDGGTGGV